MGLLTVRRILITVILSTRSIAYGVAKACQREGATLAFTYANEDLRERVAKIAAEFGPCPVLACNVSSDDEIAALFDSLRAEWNGVDGLLHSIAFAPRVCRRARHLELHLRGAGQGCAPAADRSQCIAFDAHVSRFGARGRELQ